MNRIIGVAGTAKNTGKTTTTTAIMAQAFQKGIKLGLTSIGYDGEDLDNVTGLPKPRITAQQGTIVAIAEGCLPACNAVIKTLRRTEVKTALGRIIIGEVTEPGLVLVAGPNKSSELRMINQELIQNGCKLILVDGALNRIAPMVETDGLIMATGASRTTQLAKLAEETKALAEILNLPLWEGQGGSQLTVTSILTPDMVQDLFRRLTPEVKEIVVTGIIGENSFANLMDTGAEFLAGRTLILTDPIKILVAGTPDRMWQILKGIEEKGAQVVVKKKISLLAITINPFYPRYRYVSHDYEPAYVDKEKLKQYLSEKTHVPIINVVDEGIEELWATLDVESKGLRV